MNTFPSTIGLIGGLGWESTALYYRLVNREVGRRRGRLHSASINVRSLDFEPIAVLQRGGDWDAMAALMSQAATDLVGGGADCVLIGSNTMHRVAPAVTRRLARLDAGGVPLIHIADATAEAILATPVRRIGLLGTRMTMEQRFYADHLAALGIECLTPLAAERDEVHRIIFEELFLGRIEPASRAALAAMIAQLVDRGAQGIVLGCTELPLIVGAQQSAVPIFDTTELHAIAAVDFSLTGRLPFQAQRQNETVTDDRG